LGSGVVIADLVDLFAVVTISSVEASAESSVEDVTTSTTADGSLSE